MPWFEGTHAALPPRARPHRVGPQPDRLPLPGPDGSIRPMSRRAPRLPRLRGAGGLRGVQARATRSSCSRRAGSRASRGSTPSTGELRRGLSRRCRCTLLLEDDVDVSRGDMICRLNNQPHAARDARRDGLLDGRRADARGRPLRDQAHQPLVPRPSSTSSATGSTSTTLHRDEEATRSSASTRSAACTCAPASRCSSTSTGDNRSTGSFILDRRSHELHRGRRHGRSTPRSDHAGSPGRVPSSPATSPGTPGASRDGSAGTRSGPSARCSGSPACRARASRRSPRASRPRS